MTDWKPTDRAIEEARLVREGREYDESHIEVNMRLELYGDDRGAFGVKFVVDGETVLNVSHEQSLEEAKQTVADVSSRLMTEVVIYNIDFLKNKTTP